MLVASTPIGIFDRYRVPYVVEPATGTAELIRIAREDGRGAELFATAVRPNAAALGPAVLEDARLHARVADPWTAERLTRTLGGDWSDQLALTGLDRPAHVAIKRRTDGSVLVPFDLDSPLDALLHEKYILSGRGVRRVVTRGYYRARTLIPYRVQMGLRRRYRAIQERTAFPAWPTETSLHRLEALLLRLVEDVAGEPLPWLSPWPEPYEWSLVLTHDVERRWGYERIDRVREVEAAYDLRSAWYLVPERDYIVGDDVLSRLRAAGCEIGLHGLRHDGRDMSPGEFNQRLTAMRGYADRWDVEGFRSPSTHRNEALIRQLGVRHDSSWSDVAIYEPEPGGTCSWLPYFIDDVVELPITLPQDHTLFHVRNEQSDQVWVDKTSFLRGQRGMALMLTHPDYLNDEILGHYNRFLALQADDSSVWHALPREVAAWWRRRASSAPARENGSWVVHGPAAGEARVHLGAPVPPPAAARA